MVTIIGIKLNNRIENAVEVQELLTRYGCYIKTRIGLHEEHHEGCSPCGLILLELTDDTKAQELGMELCDISGIEIQHMRF